MKNLILTLTVLLCTKALVAQTQTRKVLFLGNSYTYVNDLPQILSDIAYSTGDILIYDSNLIGGYTLQGHFENVTSKNKILSDDWDYIVLQEQSQLPAFEVPMAFMNGFSNLKNYITQHKPCAMVTSFMTWGYLNGDSQNCNSFPLVCDYLGMQNLISERYMSISDMFQSEVTPVGEVWKYIKENYPTINLYQSDGSHPSLAGSYLAACSFYTSIFRKNPELITEDYGLDSNTAAIIRSATKSIIFDQMQDWYIGKYIPNSNFNYIIGNGTNEIIINSNTTEYYNSFIWDFGDGTTSTSLLPTHNYSSDGTYTIKLTSTKCYLGEDVTSIMERTVTFCSHTNTIFPDLLLCPDETGVVWTQQADSYQWCDTMGSPIPDETNQSLVVYPGESYSVLTTVDGCTEMSPQVFIDSYMSNDEPPCNLNTIDIDNPTDFLIYPNPTKDIINIDIDFDFTLKVYNILGKEVSVIRKSNNSIDVSNLKNGMYLLEVIVANMKTITKIIKN